MALNINIHTFHYSDLNHQREENIPNLLQYSFLFYYKLNGFKLKAIV